MRRTVTPSLRRFASLLALALSASPASAAVTFYNNAAQFELDTGATIVADFEARAVGNYTTFTEGGVLFRSHPPLSGVFILGPGPHPFTHPDPTSKVLSRSGPEDFDLIPQQATCALGFDTITNQFGPPVVTVYAPDGSVMATYTLTQARNTFGFVGVRSTDPIGMVRWRSVQGETENTCLDNVRTAGCLTQALPSTWGRVKAMAR